MHSFLLSFSRTSTLKCWMGWESTARRMSPDLREPVRWAGLPGFTSVIMKAPWGDPGMENMEIIKNLVFNLQIHTRF
jgi:hypothetical protein